MPQVLRAVEALDVILPCPEVVAASVRQDRLAALAACQFLTLPAKIDFTGLRVSVARPTNDDTTATPSQDSGSGEFAESTSIFAEAGETPRGLTHA